MHSNTERIFLWAREKLSVGIEKKDVENIFTFLKPSFDCFNLFD